MLSYFTKSIKGPFYGPFLLEHPNITYTKVYNLYLFEYSKKIMFSFENRLIKSDI